MLRNSPGRGRLFVKHFGLDLLEPIIGMSDALFGDFLMMTPKDTVCISIVAGVVDKSWRLRVDDACLVVGLF